MHICFASLDYPDETSGGGVGFYVKTMGRELVRKGHRVSVIALKKGRDYQDRTDDHGVNIYGVNPGNIHWYISKLPIIGKVFALSIRELEYSRTVLHAVQKIDRSDHIDIVESTETGACYLHRLGPEIKTVIRLHGDAYTFLKYTPPRRIPINVRISRHLQRKSFLHSNQLSSPGSAHAAEIRSELKTEGISIKIIPNPMTVTNGIIERGAKNAVCPMFLYVGRLQKVKGVLLLLKSIPKILEKKPEAKFVFAGSVHPTIPWTEIEHLVNKLDIVRSVQFLGYVHFDELKSLYRKATAAVLPSYYESFGYTFLEALIYGVPIVAFDIASARNFIVNGKNGFLVPVDDIDALAEACLHTIDMSVKVPDRDEYAVYDVERVCAETINMYNEVLCNSTSQFTDVAASSSTAAAGRILSIFLSPHFDDALFSCGGLIHEQLRHGRDSLIVTIFGGVPDYSHISCFAQELHEKWKTSSDPVNLRRSEDVKAAQIAGAQLIQLDFLDCIYRQTENNYPLYNDYESLAGVIHPYDYNLSRLIYDRIMRIIQDSDHEEIQIFAPLGVGSHVDHQIVKTIGMRLFSEGFKTLFYEELPYCFWHPEGVSKIMAENRNEWSCIIVPIDIKVKMKSISPYSSQFAGLGGSFRKASKKFKRYAAWLGNGKFAERVWSLRIKQDEQR